MMADHIVSLNESNFKNEVLEAKVPVLVDFWAAWCGPCRMLAPVIEELAGDYEGKAKICKMNVDENSNTASGYGVMSIPTMLLFKEGKEVNRLVGFMPKDSIAQALNQVL